MEKRDIAVTIQNFVQFYSIKAGIDELIKRNYIVDIYVPITDSETGIGTMFDQTYNSLIKSNYSIRRKVDDNISYKILLEPYPMDIYLKFNFDYRIKYKYSLLSAKPNLVYNPESNIYYDCILCFSKYDSSFLNVYAKTELIGNLKYLNYKRDIKNLQKPILLYLPTFGNESSIDSILVQLKSLKEDYYIITKLHHGTTSLKNESTRIENLKNISDECYDHLTELVELLSKADVVLSDNSGSIFETLYAKVPLAIYSENINTNKLGSLDTTQFKLVKEGYIPYTNNVNEIKNVLSLALSNEYKEKQARLSNELFYRPDNAVTDFADLIEKYLKDDVDMNYKSVHDILVNDFTNKISFINELQALLTNKTIEIQNLHSLIVNKDSQINELECSLQKYSKEKELLTQLTQELNNKDKIIGFYENGKLYKICKKIYIFYYKLFKKEHKNG